MEGRDGVLFFLARVVNFKWNNASNDYVYDYDPKRPNSSSFLVTSPPIRSRHMTVFVLTAQTIHSGEYECQITTSNYGSKKCPFIHVKGNV
jgi:hypothetical protein